MAISLAQNDFKDRQVVLFVSPHFDNSRDFIYNLSNNMEEKIFQEIVILDNCFGTTRYGIERKIRFFFFYQAAIDRCQKYTYKKFILSGELSS